MLSIGKYCKITSKVTILCHDYSRSVLRRKYGEVIGEAGETVIGDNVFIGIGATICMGAHIGNNVIIGAGSVITGTVQDNSVYAGVPAHLICSLDDFYLKRKEKTVSEAILYACKFYEKNGRYPIESEMGPFWQLFMPRNIENLKEKHIFTKLSGDNENELLRDFLKSKPLFSSYDNFIEEVEKRLKGSTETL